MIPPVLWSCQRGAASRKAEVRAHAHDFAYPQWLDPRRRAARTTALGDAAMTLAPSRLTELPEARRRFRFELPSGDAAPKIARTVVTDLLALTGHTEVIDDVSVMVSELVTNVYLHTSAPVVRLDVSVQHSRVRVAVWDDAPDSDPARRLTDPGESGRGLCMVEALATRWGVYRPNAERRTRKGV